MYTIIMPTTEPIIAKGAGAMGSSIAEVFAYNGYTVYLKDQNLDYVFKCS